MGKYGCHGVWTLLLGLSLCIACGGITVRPLLPEAPPPRESEALNRAVEAYYGAVTVQAMREAVEAAKKAGPDTALYHEIAGDLALMEDRYEDRFEHLFAALLDPADDAALLHLNWLWNLSWRLRHREKAVALCEVLAHVHPNPELRRLATFVIMASYMKEGKLESLPELAPALGWRLPLALIGTWDNDQGKGFDIAYPPEHEIDLDKSYQGQLIRTSWRTELDWRQYGDLDLSELLWPNSRAVAYAVAAVDVRETGAYELRLSTSDPVKVWVNDKLVFADRHITSFKLDNPAIPVTLRAGANRILIKTAQKRGGWMLAARLTGPGGFPVKPGALKALPADTSYSTSGPAPADSVKNNVDLVAGRAYGSAGESARRDYLLASRARLLGLKVPAVKLAESFAGKHPKSLAGRYLLAICLWNNKELGRTSDLLKELADEAGDELILVRIKQARFLRQSNLKEKARKILISVRDAHPDRPLAYRRLADLFNSEGWREDRCRVLEEADGRWPGWPGVMMDLADCRKDLNFDAEAEAIYLRVLDRLPYHSGALRNIYRMSREKQDYDLAEAYARSLVRARPYWKRTWRRLGEVLRRKGDRAGAGKTFKRIVALSPTSPEGYRLLAELAYQAGDREKAIEYWLKTLDRDPDNEKLANRMAFLAPPERGPWAVDVPDEKALEEAVALRDKIDFPPGADALLLLDHEVVELKPDGSTTMVITEISHALNESGRDSITRFNLRGGGRSRILHAYAVGPDYRRVEASSIRGRAIRFRNLKIGSSVVVQYRLDKPPSAFLGEYFTGFWRFQNYKRQFVDSRYVLWAPEGAKVSEYVSGDIKREERRENGMVRMSWSAANTPVLIPEYYSSPLREIAWSLSVSTVPDWGMFQKWESALLHDVFRESPEVIALAKKLFDGAGTAEEKLARIQAYLMKNIRYQMDYERTISGVKPHSAPMILARQYGDCKDKAVLFITLARLGGIEAHFALVRTRYAGAIRRETPSQQFNHAIVYAPPQPGYEKGRFFDPTVDALDVSVLRRDDQGVWAFVLDPETNSYAWREIPFQPAGINYVHKKITLDLKPDGGGRGEVLISAQGGEGMAIRKSARNPENLAQMLQWKTNELLPGARVVSHETVQVTDVHNPAQVKIEVEAPTLARLEGKELRMRLPIDWTPKGRFALAERKHPLVLGVPCTLIWEVELILPKGANASRLPESKTVKTKYLSFERKVSQGNGRILATIEAKILMERIPPEDYQAIRAETEKIMHMFKDEVAVRME